jgi:N-acetyl-1-D-myo-inositol-2-amino-2-deoxy-alpha-D-glucopyranoside deacetylase
MSLLRMGFEALKELGEETPFGVTSPEELAFGDPDEIITTRIDARDFLDAKNAAMRAHRTQILVDGPFFALSNRIGQREFGLEHYRLIRGTPPEPGEVEEDLFAGV